MKFPGCGVTQVTLAEPRECAGWGRQGSMSGKGSNRSGQPDDVIVRKAERGWVVGDENVSDLTSAMVLADLFAADQVDDSNTTVMEAVDEKGAPRRPSRATAPAPRANDSGPQRIPAVSGAAGIADKSGEAGEAA